MKFTECNNPAIPPDSALALRNPAGLFHGYEKTIINHEKYWQNRLIRSKEEVRLAHFDIAHTMAEEFKHSERAIVDVEALTIAGLLITEKQQTAAEAIRQKLLATLGLSRLCRIILSLPDITSAGVSSLDDILTDAAAYGATDFLFELPEQNEQGLLLSDPRIHIARRFLVDMLPASFHGPTPEEGAWYQNKYNTLYVRCDSPTQPKDKINEAQKEFSLEVDTMATLTPFVPSRL